MKKGFILICLFFSYLDFAQNFNFEAIPEDLPANANAVLRLQESHMILNIPREGKVDIWLECTSSYLPFGYVTPSNDDRNVLVIKEEGGVIKQSTRLQDNENIQENTTLVKLDDNGNMGAIIQKKPMGSQFNDRYTNEIHPSI